MFIRFILLLTIAFIAVQGQISSSNLQSDAIKLTDLYKKYINHPSAVQMLGAMRETCPWLIDCCPDELAHFTTLMFQNKFFGKCINSANQMGASNPTCKKAPFPAPEANQESRGVDPQSRLAKTILPWINWTERACSPSELQAFYCERDAMNKFQSCQVRTLQLVARENGDNYGTFIQGLEEDLNAFYDQVISASMNEKA